MAAYTAVYAPAGVRQAIAHVWWRDRRRLARVVLPTPVMGGRARASAPIRATPISRRRSRAAIAVDVITASGQLIGRLRVHRHSLRAEMDSIWVELVLIGVSIIANGFFAGSEIALVSARPSRLAELRDQGVSGAAVATALKRDPERFLATLQIAITLVGTLASAVGGAAAVDALEPWLASLALPGAERWAEPVALGVRGPAHHLLLAGDGRADAEGAGAAQPRARWAARVARPVAWLVRVLAAPGRILTGSTRVVLTLIGSAIPRRRRWSPRRR